MINDPEKRLIEALKNVDAHGDVAPHHVHDPMTMVLRGNAIQAVYRASKAALNTMMRSVGARQRGSSRPTNKRTLIARPIPSSGSIRDRASVIDFLPRRLWLVAAGGLVQSFCPTGGHLGYRLSCISV